jgi:heme/copper-type cytochrome/quinol oxidase subunit 2
MNKWQLMTLWIVGVYVALIISGTGAKLLVHAEKSAETLETGYPFTLLAGTVWTYVLPIIIVCGLVLLTLKDHKKK